MPTHHRAKAAMAIKEIAADYLNRNPIDDGFVTVIRAAFDRDGRRITIFVSVLPPERGPAALIALHRIGGALQEYLRTRLRLGLIPYLDFALETTAAE